jgi:hypothetical protein
MALGYGLDDRGFESRQGLGIFLLTRASRPALGPSQHPIQWEPGALSLGVKLPGCETDHSPPASAEVKNAWNCAYTPPMHLRGVVLCIRRLVGPQSRSERGDEEMTLLEIEPSSFSP